MDNMKFPQALTLVLVASKVFGKNDISWVKALSPTLVYMALGTSVKFLESFVEVQTAKLDDSSK